MDDEELQQRHLNNLNDMLKVANIIKIEHSKDSVLLHTVGPYTSFHMVYKINSKNEIKVFECCSGDISERYQVGHGSPYSCPFEK